MDIYYIIVISSGNEVLYKNDKASYLEREHLDITCTYQPTN